VQLEEAQSFCVAMKDSDMRQVSFSYQMFSSPKVQRLLWLVVMSVMALKKADVTTGLPGGSL
ncbi:hypothetical protein NDU88_002650, partial [Pleurodeles waltl]